MPIRFEAGPNRGHRIIPMVGLLVFSLLLVVGLICHEIWRDEAQAWLIATWSDTPAELWSRLASESHPLLWYLLLWPVSRLGADVALLQTVQAVTAIGYAALLLFAAPFSHRVRLGLLGGYFLVYEYAVISRSYGLTVLLILAACALFRRGGLGTAFFVGVLLLLSQTSVFGAVFAPAFLVARLAVDRNVRTQGPALGFPAASAATVLVAAGCLATVYQLFRNPYAAQHLQNGLSDATQLKPVLSPLVELGAVILPVYDFSEIAFWNQHLLADGNPVGQLLLIGVGLTTLIGGVLRLRGQRPALLFFLTSLFGLAALDILASYDFYVRHYGHGWIALIATAWLAASAGPQITRQGGLAAGRYLIAGVLGLHVLAGLFAVGYDIAYEFSQGERIAERIEADSVDSRRSPIVARIDPYAMPVVAYLERGVYLMHSEQRTGPASWTRFFDGPEQPDAEAVLRARIEPGATGFYVTPFVFRPDTDALEVELIAAPGTTIVASEAQYLYRVTHRDTRESATAR